MARRHRRTNRRKSSKNRRTRRRNRRTRRRGRKVIKKRRRRTRKYRGGGYGFSGNNARALANRGMGIGPRSGGPSMPFEKYNSCTQRQRGGYSSVKAKPARMPKNSSVSVDNVSKPAGYGYNKPSPMNSLGGYANFTANPTYR